MSSQTLVVEIVSSYTGLTPEKVEKALSYYFGSTVRFSVTESAQTKRGADSSKRRRKASKKDSPTVYTLPP